MPRLHFAAGSFNEREKNMTAAQTGVQLKLASARLALSTTYRHRAMLPSCEWNAYLTPAGGILVANADDCEDGPMPEWRKICKIWNNATDDQNMRTIEAELQRI
jgi:hypothetical protein